MKLLIFWKSWSKPEKAILLLSGLVLFTCLSIYFYRFYLGVNGAIEWQANTDIQRVEQTLSSFERFGETFEIKGSNFINRTFFSASAIELNPMHTKLFFGFFCFSFILILTGISFIKKSTWFAVAMTFIGVGLYFFSFDLLESFGLQNNIILSIGFFLFVGITALFNIIKENKTSLLIRLAGISFVVVTFFSVIILNAQVEIPIYYLTNYSAKSLSIVVFLFSALVGYDILAFFFYIITSSKSFSSSKSLMNFLVISALYLGSLFIFFLHQIHYISWNITLFNPFILLVVSTVLGFWGQHKRRELFLEELNYRKGGVWIYMGMAILSISSVAYAFQTSNTAMIASFEEGIIYTHLTMGGAFVIYVMKNFRVPILEGLSVWGRLYFPEELTHRFIRFIGLASIILLVIVDNETPIRRWKAGLSNYKADVYQQEGEFLLAEKNYRFGYAYYPNNFKAHYTLAMTAFNNGDFDKSIKLFKDMVTYRVPNEFALVNMANAYAQKEDFYNAHFTLKKALTKYPENGQLLNNIAFYAEKDKDVEKAYSNYLLAETNLPKDKKHFAYANLLAFSGDSQTIDSLVKLPNYNDKVEVVSNKIALANLNNIPFQTPSISLKDSVLGMSELSYLINSLNSSLTNDKLRKQAFDYSQKAEFNQDLLTYALAVNACRRFDYLATDSLLKQTITSAKSSVEPYYYNEAGKMYLAFGDEERAEICFKTSDDKQPLQPINNAPIHLAKLQLKNGRARSGVELLQHLTQFEPTKQEANHLLYALSINKGKQLETLPKEVLTDVANYNPWFVQNNILQAVLTKRQLSESVALASFGRAIENGEYASANTIWEAIKSIETVKKSPFVKLRLEQLYVQNRKDELTKLVNENSLKGYEKVYSNYFKAISAEGKGNIPTAEKYFQTALKDIPFYEPLGLAVVNFYAQTKKDEKEAYEIIRKLIHYHELSLDYNLMYIHLSLSQGDFFFADEAIKDIETLGLMNEVDFIKYKEIYKAKRQHAIEKLDEEW